jgi:cell division transport system permease protein
MLTAWQRWKDYQLIAIRHSGECLRHSPWSTAMTVIVIALTMMLPALLWLMSKNMQNVFTDWQRSGPISIYIAKTASESDQQILLQRIMATEGVKSATLVSAENGLAAFKQQTGMQDLAQYLPENPLPAVIHVVTSSTFNSVEELQNLYQLLRKYPNVEQATLDLEWINTLYSTINVVRNVIWVLMLLLSTVVILIIGNTLRLAMDRRRDEIHVLNLLGASKAYIVRPHLYTGMWYGMASACLMLLFVDIGMSCLGYILQPLADINIIQHLFLLLSWQDMLILMLASIILGFIGAKISINRLFATMCVQHIS